ncbi:hypothetical protein HELRODRAFT_174287 [Helobdella robusta]|uniref:Uncharacterized protein n=1 Tax=Helobdella robusta TaxID=6412 RepID=T1F7Y1_HELRO|nr:hypothetical protein HELRODRAFT_174287 [Helobdella robusta]ESO02854.1 hypothetical protein HELRODRAFT_174287 [Helobdella robusta]
MATLERKQMVLTTCMAVLAMENGMKMATASLSLLKVIDEQNGFEPQQRKVVVGKRQMRVGKVSNVQQKKQRENKIVHKLMTSVKKCDEKCEELLKMTNILNEKTNENFSLKNEFIKVKVEITSCKNRESHLIDK